jgi:hypothetical protein
MLHQSHTPLPQLNTRVPAHLTSKPPTPSPKGKNNITTKTKPRRTAAPAKKRQHVVDEANDDEDEVEVVSGPPQYNHGKIVLGGSNVGKQSDSVNKLIHWGGDGPQQVCLSIYW